MASQHKPYVALVEGKIGRIHSSKLPKNVTPVESICHAFQCVARMRLTDMMVYLTAIPTGGLRITVSYDIYISAPQTRPEQYIFWKSGERGGLPAPLQQIVG
jgi:hypothetical protein